MMDPSTGRHTLPSSVRLKSRRAFDRVFREGMRVSDRHLTIVMARRGDDGPARLGIAVGRRYGCAAERNRIKRLIREAFRRLRHDLPPASDWVVLPRPGRGPTAAHVEASLRTLARRLAGPPPGARTGGVTF